MLAPPRRAPARTERNKVPSARTSSGLGWQHCTVGGAGDKCQVTPPCVQNGTLFRKHREAVFHGVSAQCLGPMRVPLARAASG